MKNQPKLNLPVTSFERLLDAAALFFAGATVLLVFIQFSSLPAEIPTHFNIQGAVDRYGSKNTILFLPLLSLIIVCGLIFLTRFPHTFNYPTKITPENAAFSCLTGCLSSLQSAIQAVWATCLEWYSPQY
jgi:uncharacterized membrane protein